MNSPLLGTMRQWLKIIFHYQKIMSDDGDGIGKTMKKCLHTMALMYKRKISESTMKKLSDTKKHKQILIASSGDYYSVVRQISPIKLSDKNSHST
jgi:hypothetical protein